MDIQKELRYYIYNLAKKMDYIEKKEYHSSIYGYGFSKVLLDIDIDYELPEYKFSYFSRKLRCYHLENALKEKQMDYIYSLYNMITPKKLEMLKEEKKKKEKKRKESLLSPVELMVRRIDEEEKIYKEQKEFDRWFNSIYPDLLP